MVTFAFVFLVLLAGYLLGYAHGRAVQARRHLDAVARLLQKR